MSETLCDYLTRVTRSRANLLRISSLVNTSSSQQLVYSVAVSRTGGASRSESVLGSAGNILGVLLATGSGGVSPLGLDGPVVSTHLSSVMGSKTGAGVSSLLSMEVLLACHSGQTVSLGSATTLCWSSSCLSECEIEMLETEEIG